MPPAGYPAFLQYLQSGRVRGFQEALATKESLLQLDLTGTQVSEETTQAWRQAKNGRRVMR